MAYAWVLNVNKWLDPSLPAWNMKLTIITYDRRYAAKGSNGQKCALGSIQMEGYTTWSLKWCLDGGKQRPNLNNMQW